MLAKDIDKIRKIAFAYKDQVTEKANNSTALRYIDAVIELDMFYYGYAAAVADIQNALFDATVDSVEDSLFYNMMGEESAKKIANILQELGLI